MTKAGLDVVVGLADRPHQQSYAPFRLDLAALGSLFVVGMPRSGRSTVLRTLAASLATEYGPSDVHLYVIEAGAPALGAFAMLPHCGAVVEARDVSRLERLLDLLREEIYDRRRLFAGAGSTDLAEQRRSGVGDPLPYIVVMLDGLDAFVAAYAERDGGRLIDEIENLVREGAAVGVITVLATDRTGFTHRLASAIGARLVLRQSDTADFALFGVERKSIPGSMSAGRAVWAATGEEVQIAVLCADPSGQAQNEAVARLAAEVGQFADSAVLPKRVDSLPVEITLDEAEMLRLGVRQSGCCTIAVGGARLGPVDVDLADAGTFLICGPSRSGRSTALVALVQSLVRQGGTEVVLICPRPSPLRELAREVGVRAVYGDGCSEDLTALADEDVVVVVDDAELINDQRTIAALERLARGSRDGGPPLVAAATTDDVLLSRFRGWLAEMRRSRSGLLLRPTSSVDGEAFELRLPRSIGNGWPAGRALLVERGSHQEVQVVVAHSPGSAKL